ncbi:MAG: hypothetical protein JXA43_02895 [Candidatus Diapherotrites archaeon]|nr:hypothetical protein [Candidatus Diapherotrites archaeon]
MSETTLPSVTSKIATLLKTHKSINEEEFDTAEATNKVFEMQNLFSEIQMDLSKLESTLEFDRLNKLMEREEVQLKSLVSELSSRDDFNVGKVDDVKFEVKEDDIKDEDISKLDIRELDSSEKEIKWTTDKPVSFSRKNTEEREYECPTCGCAIPESANSCPECGESFDEDDNESKEDVYECPTCGGEVEGDATKCQHCGEEFE